MCSLTVVHPAVLAHLFLSQNVFSCYRYRMCSLTIECVLLQLCILPCWHIFERFAEYYALLRGATLVYSSVKTFKKDLQARIPMRREKNSHVKKKLLLVVPCSTKNSTDSQKSGLYSAFPFWRTCVRALVFENACYALEE